MHKEIRKQMILRRKNFLPSLIVTFFLLLTLSSIVYFTDPRQSVFILLFFINLFALLFFLTSILSANSKRGLIISVCLTFFVILRYFGIGNILNAILLSGLGIITLLYSKITSKR